MPIPEGIPYKWTMHPEELDLCMRSIVAAATAFPQGNFVEVGTMDGYSSERFLKKIDGITHGARYLGVDIDPVVVNIWWKRVRGLRLVNVIPRLITDDTKRAYKKFVGEINWLLVDACHCFECALWDIENWGSRVVVGGHLIAHDTLMNERRAKKLSQHDRTRPFGVQRAVATSTLLKEKFQLVEDYPLKNGVMSFLRVR